MITTGFLIDVTVNKISAIVLSETIEEASEVYVDALGN